MLTSGPMRIGWMEVSSQAGKELGSDDKSWAFDGFRVSISFLLLVFRHLILSGMAGTVGYCFVGSSIYMYFNVILYVVLRSN